MTNKRISELNRLDDLIIYRANCSCSEKEHDLTIHLTSERKFDLLSLTFYVNLLISERFNLWEKETKFEKIKKFAQTLYNRLKLSLKLLFTGHIELEQEFIIDNKDQINGLIDALEEGKKLLN